MTSPSFSCFLPSPCLRLLFGLIMSWRPILPFRSIWNPCWFASVQDFQFKMSASAATSSWKVWSALLYPSLCFSFHWQGLHSILMRCVWPGLWQHFWLWFGPSVSLGPHGLQVFLTTILPNTDGLPGWHTSLKQASLLVWPNWPNADSRSSGFIWQHWYWQ